MIKFSEGMHVAKITNEHGILEVYDKPCVALGDVYRMTIVMQGKAPWVHVEYGEEGFPDEYFNVALLKSVVLSEFLYG